MKRFRIAASGLVLAALAGCHEAPRALAPPAFGQAHGTTEAGILRRAEITPRVRDGMADAERFHRENGGDFDTVTRNDSGGYVREVDQRIVDALARAAAACRNFDDAYFVLEGVEKLHGRPPLRAFFYSGHDLGAAVAFKFAKAPEDCIRLALYLTASGYGGPHGTRKMVAAALERASQAGYRAEQVEDLRAVLKACDDVTRILEDRGNGDRAARDEVAGVRRATEQRLEELIRKRDPRMR